MNFGLQRQGPGDADALPLPAGELVRIAAGVVGVQPDLGQHLGHDLGALGFWFPMPWICKPSPMISPTGMRGSSDE